MIDTLPVVTVVMPVRNEAAFIARSLGSVLAQDYPLERLQVLVADGMSTDRTREIIGHIRDRHSNVELVENPGQIVSTGVNEALAAARGEIVVLVGGHCELAKNYIRLCVEHLSDRNLAAVGGVLETIGETYTASAIAAAMSSRFGVGGSAFRIGTPQARLVDTAAFAAYRREALQRTGDFDEELVRNQDDEYNYRVRKLGGQILLSPEISARYYSRADFPRLWKQYFQYGYWKVRVLQKHPRQMQVRQFMPLLFVLSLCALAFASPFSVFARVAALSFAGAYAIASVVAGVVASRTCWRLSPLVPFVFPVIHCAYGLGFIVGLFAFANRWELAHTETVSSQDAAPL